MKELDYLEDMLCNEVKKITQQGDFTTSTLEMAYKIVDMLKDIAEYEEKKGHQSYDKDGSYGYWGGGHATRMPYNENYAYGNGGMNTGRGSYGYDNGYSRMSSSDKMMNELQTMMNEATSSRDRDILQRALDELKK